MGMTWKAAFAVSARKPMMTKSVHGATAAASMLFTNHCAQTERYSHPDCFIIQEKAEATHWDCLKPSARVRSTGRENARAMNLVGA